MSVPGRLILQTAAWLVPYQLREEWLAEWIAELWHVQQRGTLEGVRFCLGAFPDAIWLRRHSEIRNRLLQSPVSCLCCLAVLAAGCLFFAVRLSVMPTATSKLVWITAEGSRLPPQSPTVSLAEYQSLAENTGRLFTAVAYYRSIRTQVDTSPDSAAELSIAFASRNLFDVLNLPVSFVAPAGHEPPALIRSQRAWRKYFNGNSRLNNRTIKVNGREAILAGVLPAGSWWLPGRMDGWLLERDQRLPLQTTGFVLARPVGSRSTLGRLSMSNQQGQSQHFHCISVGGDKLLSAHLLMILVALLILPATISIGLGEYPTSRYAPPLTTRLRRWLFLVVKVALLLIIVFCGILDLAAITSTPIQAHGLLVGYLLAFRWALADQRRRCPVCLRLLGQPTRIGWCSRTFLEWYGTELICDRGHGLLHVSAISTSCYSAQRWLYLDPSWDGLFAPKPIFNHQRLAKAPDR